MIDALVDLFWTLWGYIKDPRELVQVGGYVGLTLVIFAETGLLVGFFLPGDSLLITAGLFAAKGDLNIWLLCTLLSAAAIIGDAVGYYIGRKTGPLLYNRPDSFFFRKSHLIKAREFYEEHGGKTIILARFIPIIRTFAPTVAGVAEMPYRRFALYNVFGGLLWIWGLGFVGYGLGQAVPDIEEHIHIMIVGVIFLSILPGIIQWFKAKRKAQVDVAVIKDSN